MMWEKLASKLTVCCGKWAKTTMWKTILRTGLHPPTAFCWSKEAIEIIEVWFIHLINRYKWLVASATSRSLGKPPWWIVHCQLWCPDIITGWWLSPTPLKNMKVNGKDYPIYYGKIKFMFQTTNQHISTIGISCSHAPRPFHRWACFARSSGPGESMVGVSARSVQDGARLR